MNDYNQASVRRHTRRLLLWGAAILVLFLLAVTCPGHSAHRNAIVQKLDDQYPGDLDALVTHTLGTVAVAQSLEVNKYLVVSFGRCDSELVSVGCLGHVFVFDNLR